MQKLLVTGAHGQLGSYVMDVARAAGFDAVGYGSAEFNIADPDAADRHICPGDVVVNCAAYTAVDAAETDHEAAFLGNAAGPAVLAARCAGIGARLIHVSTDYVFSGESGQPYKEDDPTDPRTVYGSTKRDGELAVLAAFSDAHIVRTAWVYSARGANFLTTMARLAAADGPLKVVDDQIGSPTFAGDLAVGLVQLAADGQLPGGVLHATNDGQTSWHGFAQQIFTELGANPDRVTSCTTAEFPRPAPRPAYSVLSGERWRDVGLTALPDWRDALHRAVAELRKLGLAP